jgi:hypothetical protein
MGGKCCGMCGGGMDDKFIFANQSLWKNYKILKNKILN